MSSPPSTVKMFVPPFNALTVSSPPSNTSRFSCCLPLINVVFDSVIVTPLVLINWTLWSHPLTSFLSPKITMFLEPSPMVLLLQTTLNAVTLWPTVLSRPLTLPWNGGYLLPLVLISVDGFGSLSAPKKPPELRFLLPLLNVTGSLILISSTLVKPYLNGL